MYLKGGLAFGGPWLFAVVGGPKGRLRARRSAVVLALLLLLLAGCREPEPIKVGFAAELTGRRGELGIAARDGATLAVEALNEAGGVTGRRVELLVRDDKGDPETARQVDAELIAQDVAAIIGHPTSEPTAAVLEQMNRAGVVLLSPTATSTDFSGQADTFFRILPDTGFLGRALGAHLYERGLRRVAGVYDESNHSYTHTLWQAARAEFERQGGGAGLEFAFTSGQADLLALADRLVAAGPEGVVFVASAIDTALLAQYCRRQDFDGPFFGVPWAQTEELLAKGGRAVEGLELVALYNPHNPFPRFQAFTRRFETRYGHPPDFGAAYAYEAVLVLAAALEQTGGGRAGLPQALAATHNLEGVQGLISLDPFGDAQRDVYITRVQDGRFEVISTIGP